MARKSRKTQNAPDTVTLDNAKYLVGAYVRLSVENSGSNTEDTIENQKAAIQLYLQAQKNMKLVGFYCDNGETGTDFDRPSFERLMADVKVGNVNCIVVKDLSRFGRNYLEAGAYLEKVFPQMNIRFISIQEHFDTLNSDGSNDCIVPLKNILNDYYAKDISMKSGSALRVKQQRGEFIGNWASYGYIKDPSDKHKLIVDEEAAETVRKIFNWRLQGLGYNAIIKKLTHQQIPSPSTYRLEKGFVKNENYKTVPWRPNTIKIILSNQVYLGHIVQGKKRGLHYLGQAQRKVLPDEWIIVKNMHEPIVDQDTFDMVQKLLSERKTAYQKRLYEMEGKTDTTENIFKGILICSCCGSKLTRYKSFNLTKQGYHVYYSYICPKHTSGCPFTSISEADLLKAVYKTVRTQIALALELEKLLKGLRSNQAVRKKLSMVEQEIKRLKEQIAEKESYRRSLFESLSKNIIDEATYKDMQKTYAEEIELLQTKLDNIKRDGDDLAEFVAPENQILKKIMNFSEDKTISFELAHTLIQTIIVNDSKHIEITLKFIDECSRLIDFIIHCEEAVA